MTLRLRLDPIACDGRGLCAELLPELIRLDDWGYPILDPRPVPAALEAHARRAVDACPLLALRLERERARDSSQGPVDRSLPPVPPTRTPQSSGSR